MGCVVNNNVLKHGIINYYEPNITPPPEPDCRTRIINRMILDYNYRLNMDRMAVAMQPKKMDEYEENMRFLKGLLDVKTK